MSTYNSKFFKTYFYKKNCFKIVTGNFNILIKKKVLKTQKILINET